MLYDVIIIGGGPAGITAGIYAARQRLKTLLITKDFGGQISRKAVSIENYPGFESISSQELIERFVNHLGKVNTKTKFGQVTKIEKKKNKFIVRLDKKNFFESRAVIIASGADPRVLEAEGEKEFLGKGLSYCAICDGICFKNKTVAVIGGGDAGFETAIFLLNIAKKIYILEYGEKVKADKTNQDIINKSGKVEIILNAQVQKFEGKKFIESLTFFDRKNKKKVNLPIDGVFIEIGNQPATSFAKGLVDFNERDEIKVNFETYQTKTPGLFAAGDCNEGKFKQIVTACGEGAKTALAVYDFLSHT